MQEKTELRLLTAFMVLYVLVFAIIAIAKGNYEFIYYALVMGALILLAVLYYKKLKLSKTVLVGLVVLGVLHLLGGNTHVFGTRLYDLFLIPGVLKYDQVIHAFGIFLVTFVAYSLLHPHLDKKKKLTNFSLALILITMAMGIGAFNEIIELFAVAFLGAEDGVGGYMNNALDLLFNLIGAIIACIFITRHHKK